MGGAGRPGWGPWGGAAHACSSMSLRDDQPALWASAVFGAVGTGRGAICTTQPTARILHHAVHHHSSPQTAPPLPCPRCTTWRERSGTRAPPAWGPAPPAAAPASAPSCQCKPGERAAHCCGAIALAHTLMQCTCVATLLDTGPVRGAGTVEQGAEGQQQDKQGRQSDGYRQFSSTGDRENGGNKSGQEQPTAASCRQLGRHLGMQRVQLLCPLVDGRVLGPLLQLNIQLQQLGRGGRAQGRP